MQNLYLKRLSFLNKLIILGIILFSSNWASAQTYCNFGGYANFGTEFSNYIPNVIIINNTSIVTDISFNNYTRNDDGILIKCSSYVTYNKSI